MNKRAPLFSVNITFLVVLLAIISTFIFQLVKNKEFQKTYWTFKVSISNQNSNPNAVKVIFINLKNDSDIYSSEGLSVSSWNFNNLLLMDDSQEAENTESYNKENRTLLPDSITIAYYSFNEKTLYHFKGDLPYKKLLELSKNSTPNEVNYVLFTIQPKGVIDVSLTDYLQQNSTPVTTLQAQKTNLYIDTLLKYSEANTLSSLSTYNDIMTKKYRWNLKTTLPPDAEIDINYYRGGIVYTNNQTKEISDFTPSRIDLRWEKDHCTYIVQYSFDAKEIYSAFEALSKEGNNGEMILNGNPSSDGKHFIFTIGNGVKSIQLKNIYEEEVRCL